MPRTNSGRDWQCGVMADPASSGAGAYAPATWMVLSTDTTAENPTRTTLPGELTGGTMARAQGAYAHTSGTASYTLIKTFVSDRDVAVRKFGVFTAASGGTLVWEKLLDETVNLKSGDSMQIVQTVSI